MDHGDHGGGSGDTNSTMDHSMMMSMSFHFGKSETILFEFWKTTDVGGMIGSCIFIFFLAIAYEALKFYRDYLFRVKTEYYQNKVAQQPPTENNGLVRPNYRTVYMKMASSFHVVQTLLHIVQMVISYFLMLIFMTYNAWLCIAVALGAGMGYFLFGWKKSIIVDMNEHCH